MMMAMLATGNEHAFAQSAKASESFLVLGSYDEASTARSAGASISEQTGLEIFLQELLTDNRVRYRLLIGVMQSPSDQEDLLTQLASVGVTEPWTLNFEAGNVPFMETLVAGLGTDIELDDGSVITAQAVSVQPLASVTVTQ